MHIDRTVDLGANALVEDVEDVTERRLGATADDSSDPDEGSPEGHPARIGGHPILAEIGRGGMGVVYLAYEPALERNVALKTIGHAGGEDEEREGVQNILREAQTAGRLCHAGIVPIHRVGFDSEHGPYYTMRYVQGRTFADILDGRRNEHTATIEAYPRRRLVGLFVQICRAVGHAHAQGVLHRDLKPSNLIVTEHGEAMVIDWGLACRVDAVSSSGRGGTVGYLAPECLRDADGIGPASDVYSLGSILHEILSLSVPARGDTPAAIVQSTLSGDLEALDPVQVWSPLLPVVQRCLDLDPSERYPDAMRLGAEIDDILEGRSPLRTVASIAHESPSPERWNLPAGFMRDGASWLLGTGASLVTARPLRGEWKAELEFSVPTDLCEWGLDVSLLSESTPGEPYVSLALGREERVSVSLRRRDRLVGRCLDLRLQPGARCLLTLQAGPSRLTVLVDDQPLIDVHEPFPLSQTLVRLSAFEVPLAFRRLELSARGAPLYLSFLSLPDQLVHRRRFGEARELYLEFHRAHPDRVEGQAALYKAALCASEQGDLAQAVREFCQLEGAALDHACALGLAHVGMVEGNVDWGSVAIADAYRRHADRRTRRELWFALMSLLEQLPVASGDERIERACCLLRDLKPDRDDAEQLVILLLDRERADRGAASMRRLAMRLLESFSDQPGVLEQALMSLHYGGLDELAISLVRNVLPGAIELASSIDRRVRFLLMGGEVALATGDVEAALEFLDEARRIVPGNHPDRVWTLGWTALARWLDGDPAAVLALVDDEPRSRTAITQRAHLTLLEALARIACDDRDGARDCLDELSRADHLWGQTAAAMLDGRSADDFSQLADRYPRRLFSEAAFYLAEYQRCAAVADHGRTLFDRIAVDWADRALFRRLSERRRAA